MTSSKKSSSGESLPTDDVIEQVELSESLSTDDVILSNITLLLVYPQGDTRLTALTCLVNSQDGAAGAARLSAVT